MHLLLVAFISWCLLPVFFFEVRAKYLKYKKPKKEGEKEEEKEVEIMQELDLPELPELQVEKI